eukprot:8747604-Pyramimonas_sp.AAC.1
MVGFRIIEWCVEAPSSCIRGGCAIVSRMRSSSTTQGRHDRNYVHSPQERHVVHKRLRVGGVAM